MKSLILILTLSLSFLSFNPKIAIEERTIYGPTFETCDCHNKPCGNDCDNCGWDGKWCYKKTKLYVTVPNSQWVFSGNPWVELVSDNQGAAGWSGFASDKYEMVTNNPDRIEVKVLTGSRSFKIRLCCKAKTIN